jgi:N-acetylmuramoyl-L-alanine amidase
MGWAPVSGWAFNDNAAISAVTVSIDGQAGFPATYGISRPDVAAKFPGRPGSPNFGWSYFLDTSVLSNGQHVLAVSATAANGERSIASTTFSVANWTTANNPMHISIDTPSSDSGPFSGIAAFGGWAVNDYASIGSVGVAVDAIPYGNAAYGGNRSDACKALAGRPGCPNVGWTFLIDTTKIGDGTHTLAITVRPVAGQSYTTTRVFQVANQATSGNSTRVNIDRPGPSDSAYSGTAAFGGWAINDNNPIADIQLFVDGVAKGNAQLGGERTDVCAKFPGRPGCPNVGWNAVVDTTSLTNGMHTLQVTSTSTGGQRATASSAFSVANGPSTGPTSVSIAQPNSSSNPFQGLAPFSGTASNSMGLDVTVSISVDGVSYGSTSACTPSFLISCPNGSWTFLLDTTQLAEGMHTFGATAVATDGTFAIASVPFQVANWSASNPMRINIDAPAPQSSAFSGIAHFGGWALDDNAPIGGVEVAIDGVSLGAASYGANRADVCKVFAGRSGCPNVGWDAFVDTGMLSNGTHTLAVTATTSNGQSSTSTSSFSVAN